MTFALQPDRKDMHRNTIYLRALMRKAGINCKQAAELVGLKKGIMLKYVSEQGGRFIRDSLLEKLDDKLFRGAHKKLGPKLKFINTEDLK